VSKEQNKKPIFFVFQKEISNNKKKFIPTILGKLEREVMSFISFYLLLSSRQAELAKFVFFIIVVNNSFSFFPARACSLGLPRIVFRKRTRTYYGYYGLLRRCIYISSGIISAGKQKNIPDLIYYSQ
jgi:hypothetical protein